MYDTLKSQIRSQLTRPRTLKPQTERHLQAALGPSDQDIQAFLDRLAEKLEEYEIEVIFGPLFTPDLEDQAALSLALVEYQPDEADLKLLAAELARERLACEIVMPDQRRVRLPLHSVLVERHLRLLRMEFAPPPEAAQQLKAALPGDLWSIGLAVSRQRAWQKKGRLDWLLRFLNHRQVARPWSADELLALNDFMETQQRLDSEGLRSASRSAVESAQTSFSAASRGRTYISSDVAEHHSFKGQGEIDAGLVSKKRLELELLERLATDLAAFAQKD